MKMIFKKWYLPLFALMLVACQENEPTPEPTPIPVIERFGVVAPDTTISVGAKIHLAPLTSTPLENSYTWTLDEKPVAQTLIYAFSSNTPGRYKLVFTATNERGTVSRTLLITVKTYVGGLYLINEGQFGTSPGSINHFNLTDKKLTTQLFQAANPTLTLGKTTCSATLWEGNFYFVSKQGRRLVVADALTFQERGALEELGGDGRAFAGVNATTGVVTTSDGAYLLDLSSLTLGRRLDGTEDEQCGSVYATSSYVFLTNQSAGMQIYSVAEDYKLVKTVPDVSVGFARSKDGALWAAGGSILYKINDKNLNVETVTMPSSAQINASWGAWNVGPLTASTTENVLYFTKSGLWGGGREIYRYVIGDLSSLDAVFATSAADDDTFYGSGIAVDPHTGDVVATYVKDGFGQNFKYNRLVVIDGKTGVEKSRTSYEGFWFPTQILFE